MQDILEKIGDRQYLTTYGKPKIEHGSTEQLLSIMKFQNDISTLLDKPNIMPDIVLFCNYRTMTCFGEIISGLEREFAAKTEWEVDKLDNTIIKFRLPAPVTITFLATKMENNYLMVGLDKDKEPIYGIVRNNIVRP